MAGRGASELVRDHRSLKAQIDEDDEIIELGQDTGSGITKFIESDDEVNRSGKMFTRSR